jgi:anaerobic selenocysteine-containing dehydrogenase
LKLNICSTKIDYYFGTMKVYNTACPRNCYSSCSFKVSVADDKIISIKPQPKNEATAEGPCLKGLSYVERTHSSDRILHPLLKKDGKFSPITWEQTYKLLTTKLKYYRDTAGPHSILYYAASGSSGLLNEVSSNFWRLFGGATTVFGNLCWPAGLEASRLTLGSVKHNAPWDLKNAKLIILWGKNPVETNIHQMSFIEQAQQHGAKLVVIDPRRTASSEKAQLLLQPRPGTDALLALTIAKILVKQYGPDKDFIDTHVLGYPEFIKSLETIDIVQSSKICGVDMHLIEKLTNWIGTIKPMTLIPGYGMQRYTNGGQTMRCLLSLSVITGNIGKSGACWHYANLQSYVFDKIKEPLSYFPDKSKDAPFRRVISTSLLGEQIPQIKEPALKMAWIERGNPLTQNPDTNKILKAFRALEFIVVVDQFMTDTAMEADLILPSKSMFEQSDIIGSYWNPYVQLKQKVIDPPGEVKPETSIYFELANRLGFSQQDIENNFPNPTDEGIEKWLSKYLCNFEGLSLKELKLGPVLAPETEQIAFSDLKFDTPSGKIELMSIQAKNLWGVNVLPTYECLKEGGALKQNTYPINLLSPNIKNRIHSQFGNLKLIKMLDPFPYVQIHPIDASSRNLKEGDLARIFNERGEIFIRVKTDNGIRPGNIAVFNGYWTQEGANPNLLSKGRETDMGHGAAFHDNRVEIEKKK